jgi:RNA polymerase sigma-70 factor (ECF subfamily)
MSWNDNGSGRPDATGVEYLDGLYSYALVLTCNQAEAADLVEGWLFTILGNVRFNQLRKRRVEELPMKFRENILLREYEALSHLEIASILDCPVETVMSRLGRARAKLYAELSETLRGPDSPSMRGTK